MATTNSKAKAATTEATQNETVVNQLGDVTERDIPEVVVGTIVIQPLSELPAEYASLKASYPTAKGFTVEGSSVALHF